MQSGQFMGMGHQRRLDRQPTALVPLLEDLTDELEELDSSLAEPDETEVRSPRAARNERLCVGVPALVMSKPVYGVGEEITVAYSGLPGNPEDWIGLFGAGMNNEDFLDYYSCEGQTGGVMTFRGLRAGAYEARLFFNDSYAARCHMAFFVKEKP